MSERNTAIVLAAGQGKRMHSKVQKQFLEIQGYPVLYYSLRCFQESPLIQDIILVTGEESISYCKEEIVQKYGFTKVSAVIPGGKERYAEAKKSPLSVLHQVYSQVLDSSKTAKPPLIRPSWKLLQETVPRPAKTMW